MLIRLVIGDIIQVAITHFTFTFFISMILNERIFEIIFNFRKPLITEVKLIELFLVN